MHTTPQTPLCTEGHQIAFMCTTMGCSTCSLFCSTQSCSSRSPHRNCMMSAQFHLVYSGLLEKCRCMMDANATLHSWFQDVVKKATIALKEFQVRLYQSDIVLKGDESDLYRYLQECQWSKVTSHLASSVVQSLIREPKLDTQKSFHEILTDKQKFSKELQQMFDVMNEHLSVGEIHQSLVESANLLNKFRFADCHSDLVLSSDHMTVCRKSNVGRFFEFCSLEPSLNHRKRKVQSVQMKVVRSNGIPIIVGVVEKETLTHQKYLMRNSDCGFYAIKSQGLIVNQDDCDNYKKSTFTFAENDLIKLEFWARNSVLNFTNLTKGFTGQIKLNADGKELCFCVGLEGGGQQVHIIPQL